MLHPVDKALLKSAWVPGYFSEEEGSRERNGGAKDRIGLIVWIHTVCVYGCETKDSFIFFCRGITFKVERLHIARAARYL